ncbi:MAG TPA: FAD-dependent oxidoreductase, partial [Thermomicrobiales bacterium]|nr:FAD-dependent oxidoreductase [Thermomicrobiales bacterium]
MRGRLALGALGAAAAGGVAWRAVRRPSAREGPSHVSLSEEEYEAASTRVLILGSGFGGLSTALELDRRLAADASVSVLAIDSSGSLLFTPLLWMVADGRVSPTNVAVPVRAFQRGRRFHVLHADVERIDLERREVHSNAGTHRYDVLVVALGSITA